MAGVDFLINIKGKGLEFIDKSKKQIDELIKAEDKLEKQTKENTDANEDLADSNKEIVREQDKTIKSTNKVGVAFRNMKDDVKSNVKPTEDLSASAKKMGIALGAALATASAALAVYSKKIIDLTDAQKKMADKAGLDFDNFYAFAQIASLSGIEAENLSEKLIDMNIAITEANMGKGELLEFLTNLNVDIKELSKLNPEEQFYRISEAIKDLPKNEQLIILDKAKIKDIALLAYNYESLRDASRDLLDSGLVPKNAEEFEKFNDNIATGKLNIQNFTASVLGELLPGVNQLAEKLKSTNEEEGFFSPENVKELSYLLNGLVKILYVLSNAVLVVKNSIDIIMEVFIGFAFVMKDVLITPALLAIDVFKFFGNFLSDNFTIALTKMKNGLISAGLTMYEFGASAKETYADILDGIGKTEAAEKQRAAASLQRERIAEARSQLKEESKDVVFDTSSLEKLKLDASQTVARINGDVIKQVGNRVSEQVDELSEAIANIVVVVQDDGPDVVKPITKLKDKVKEDVKKVIEEVMPTVEDYQKMIDIISLKFKVGDESVSSKEDYIAQVLEKYNKILDIQKKGSVEYLTTQAKIVDFNKSMLDKEIKATQEKLDIFEKIKMLDKEFRAGVIQEDLLLSKSVVEYNNIIDSSKDVNEVLDARIGLLETEKKIEENIKKLKDKKEADQEKIILKRAEALRSEGKELEAIILLEDLRINKVREQFDNLKDQAEAVEIEKSLINTDKTQARINIIKDQIEDLNKTLNENNFFSQSDENAQIQKDLIKLKKEQIALEGDHKKAIENTGAFSLFTYEKVIEIGNNSIDIFGRGISNIVAGTKTGKEAVKEMTADVLSEFSKIALRQTLLNVSSYFGGGVGGNAGSSLVSSFISGVARNHSGIDVVTPDHTSGNFGLQPDEVLRVLNTKEMVMNRSDVKNVTNNNGNSRVTANVNINPSTIAPAIIREGYANLDDWAKTRGII